jgi:hypothetical protein
MTLRKNNTAIWPAIDLKGRTSQSGEATRAHDLETKIERTEQGLGYEQRKNSDLEKPSTKKQRQIFPLKYNKITTDLRRSPSSLPHLIGN